MIPHNQPLMRHRAITLASSINSLGFDHTRQRARLSTAPAAWHIVHVDRKQEGQPRRVAHLSTVPATWHIVHIRDHKEAMHPSTTPAASHVHKTEHMRKHGVE